MRRDKDALVLGSADIPALIRAATPLDPDRLSARAFPPAVRFIASVGHVLRARRDPRAWIREMGFDLRVDELVLRGPAAELDELARIIERSVEPSDLPLPIVFAYEDTGLEDGERHYRPGALVTLSSGEAAALLDEPASQELTGTHAAKMLRSFAEFFDDWLDGHHIEVASARWTGRVHGIRYEPSLGTERRRRSELEAPRPVARSGVRGIFSRIETELDPYRSAALLEPTHVRRLFARERDRGATIRRDVELRGERWAYLLMTPDGQKAVGIVPEGLMFRLTGAMVLDDEERRTIEGFPHAEIGPRG